MAKDFFINLDIFFKNKNNYIYLISDAASG